MSTNFLAQFSANLSTISAANINYSILIGSTIIASSIISNSTINVSSITSRAINYSTLTGSTLIAQAVHYSTLTGSTTTNNTMVVNSTLTGSTILAQTVNYSTLTGSTILAQTVNYSTLTGSTTTNNTMVVNSTLMGSTMTVQTVNYSTLIGSTILAQAVNYSTLTGSTTTNNTMVVNSTLTGSTINANTLSIASTITTSNILASGNVGIGTASITGVLHVYSPNATSIMVGNSSNSTSLQLAVANNAGDYSSSAVAGDSIIRTNGTANLMLQCSSGGSAIYVKNNNNVGIGTTVANAPLQFANTNVNRKIVLFASANNDHEFYGFGVNAGVLRYQTQGDHIFYTGTSSTASTELMRITGTGNVGIGTTNPYSQLSLHAAFTASGLFPTSSITWSTTNGTPWRLGSITGYVAAGSGGSTESLPGGLAFATKAADGSYSSSLTTRMVLDAGGNLGIGTTNPKNLLHVNGIISTPWIQFNNSLVGSPGWHIYDNGTTDTLYILQGSANNGVYLANGGGSWTSWSDIRIKNTINPISGALNIINQLNPVTFYYKSDIKYEFLKSGFIAQEVQTILPDLVSDSSYSNEYGSNLLGVETTGFIPFIIKAIQEQNEIIQQQSNKLQQQAAEITALQSTVAQNIQPQVNAQQIQIAELMSQINQLTQRLVAAGIA